MKETYIEVTQITTFFNGQPHTEFECKWIGSKYTVVEVSKLLASSQSLSVYPWPLKVIDDNVDFGRSMLVVRKDVGWHIWWLLVALWYKLFRSRGYYNFKWRVLMTLELWGLAYQPEGEIVSWKNIGRRYETKKDV